MRWGMKIGDKESFIAFAFFPVKLSDDSWVWLEWVKVTKERRNGAYWPYTKITKQLADPQPKAREE